VKGYPAKRPLDLLLVIGSVPLWVPVLAVLGVLVGLTMGRPVLFRQRRGGLGGIPFTILKLRTMRDALGSNGTQLPDVERLSSVGRWLRATSLDELPELFNVLRGDMSLVGPRPLLADYLPLYSEQHRRRHEVRPGLTGLAQVSGRNALSWTERLDLDVEYVERCSLTLDLRILAQTLVTVLRGRGVAAPGEATMAAFTGYAPPPSPASPSPPPAPQIPRRPGA
jgi:lipopolysaccharide/colanic/teichoic acid biosynthesis glycosyltransferase